MKRVLASWGVLPVLLALLTLSTVLVGGQVAFATGCEPPAGPRGGLEKDFAGKKYTGDGCDKHHMPSQQSYLLADYLIKKGCRPVILMDPNDHQRTGTWGTDGQDERDEEATLITTDGVEEAFERAAADVEDEFPGKYTDAIDEARDALDRLDTPECDPQDPDQSTSGGSTNITHPGGSPPTVDPTGYVTVSGTGLASGQIGNWYDLVLADADQLAIDSDCNDSPTIVSYRAVKVNSSGALPSVGGKLDAPSWEGSGEYDYSQTPADGPAQVCFVETSNPSLHTAPAAFNIYDVPAEPC